MMTIIINGMILALLIGSIGYTYLMDLRVRKLLAALKEMEPMISQFSKAVDQSETSLEKFKQATVPDEADVRPVKKTADNGLNKKNLTFETSRKPMQNHIGQISLPGKSELVKSFFENAEKLEL
ncbi:MAG: flagellar motor switch protein [Amylibacter sp.]|nr:flagellar motor switch protein [Amylibacter sp.]